MKLIKIFVCIFALAAIFCPSVGALETSAQSAILINADTFSVIYSKNADQRLPMASTTKIMTALLLAEQNTPDKTVTTTKEMVYVEGTYMGLKVGDTVSYRDLIYGMLLPSGNDAANTAAIAISGSMEKFALKMNNKALELGLHNTNFVTPSGLDAENHYTTAYDLSIITAYALRNADFAAAAASKTKAVTISGQQVTLSNHNKMLKTYEGAIGVKTGYTSKSGRCLVSAAKRGNVTLIAVTLNDRNDWQDHTAMLNYGFSVVKESVIFPESTVKSPLLSAKHEFIELEYEPLEIGVTKQDNITSKVFLPQVLSAPLTEGEVVGYTEYYSSGRLVTTKSITARQSIADAEPQINIFKKLYKTYLLLLGSI